MTKEFIVQEGTKVIFNNQFGSRDDLVEVCIPKSVEFIRAGAFYNCVNLESVVFEAGSALKQIGNYTFQNCENLKQIKLPEGVIRIGAHAFWHCTKLPSTFDLPDSVKLIEATAFYNTNIRTVNISVDCEYQSYDHGFPYQPSFPVECVVRGGAKKDFYLHLPFPLPQYNKNMIYDVEVEQGVLQQGYIVPQGTKIIENNQFGGRTDLQCIVIPRSVEYIGASAFYYCTNLKTVIIEKHTKLKYIDYFVFQNCLSLEKVVIPEGVEQIRAHSFWACTSLKELALPGTMRYVDASALFSTGLQEITLNELCMYQVKGHGFPYEASFPEDCTIKGGIPCDFYKEYPLPVSVIEVDQISAETRVNTCFIVPEGTKRIKSNQFAKRKDLEEIVIPKSVEIIGAAAFYMCINLKKVTFETGSKLKSIEGYAFQNCFSLEHMELPYGLEQIIAHSFWACPNLKEIHVPDSVKIIDACAFYTTNISNVDLPIECKYQEKCHGFPYESTFPDDCIVNGGVPCDLYGKAVE